jgi:hypothetical protein
LALSLTGHSGFLESRYLCSLSARTFALTKTLDRSWRQLDTAPECRSSASSICLVRTRIACAPNFKVTVETARIYRLYRLIQPAPHVLDVFSTSTSYSTFLSPVRTSVRHLPNLRARRLMPMSAHCVLPDNGSLTLSKTLPVVVQVQELSNMSTNDRSALTISHGPAEVVEQELYISSIRSRTVLEGLSLDRPRSTGGRAAKGLKTKELRRSSSVNSLNPLKRKTRKIQELGVKDRSALRLNLFNPKHVTVASTTKSVALGPGTTKLSSVAMNDRTTPDAPQASSRPPYHLSSQS